MKQVHSDKIRPKQNDICLVGNHKDGIFLGIYNKELDCFYNAENKKLSFLGIHEWVKINTGEKSLTMYMIKGD